MDTRKYNYKECKSIFTWKTWRNYTRWMDDRIKYSLNLLIKYSEYLKPIQQYINRKDFANGM